MNRYKNSFSAILTAALLFFGLYAQAEAQGRVNERQVGNIITRLNVKLDDFRYSLDDESNNNRVTENDADQINDYLKDLNDDVDAFQEKLSNRADSPDDVRRILESAKSVNDNASRLRLSAKAQNDWKAARTLLDQLATTYSISWNWSGSTPSQYPNQYPPSNSPTNANYNNGLTGTYQLDTSRSENVKQIAAEAINNIDPQRRDEARRDLEQKLESPDQLAIDLRGSQVTLASTLAQQITFPADGTERTETLPNGTTVKIKATLRGQVLTVSSVGSENDYTVTFTTSDNGKSLRVTRRMTTDYLRQTIFVESVYNKTDAVAQLDNLDQNNGNTASNTNYPTNNQGNYPTNTSGNYPPNTSGNYPPTTTVGRTGQFIVPNGTILTGILDNPMISTKISQNNDRFSLRVQAPTQFRGAVVEGYISGINSSGRVSGRSQLTFNFETIRLANGQTYDFAGYLQSVTDDRGKTIKVDAEGSAKGSSQTNETIKRGGIGAGVGAVLGAIIGGGKGAAVGAIIGGGAGAGSVYVQDDGDLELKQGSSFTFQSSSPVR